MFTRLVASNRSLRRRTMNPGALILSSVFHGTLLAGAVYASVPSEEPREPRELATYLELAEPRRPGEAGSASPIGGRDFASDFAPPRILADAGTDGEVIAEFVVLADGTVDLTTVRIVNAPHDGFEAATRSLLRQLRFTPGRLNGEPVAAMTRLPIAWRVGGD